jgi:hypothetical protein
VIIEIRDDNGNILAQARAVNDDFGTALMSVLKAVGIDVVRFEFRIKPLSNWFGIHGTNG